MDEPTEKQHFHINITCTPSKGLSQISTCTMSVYNNDIVYIITTYMFEMHEMKADHSSPQKHTRTHGTHRLTVLGCNAMCCGGTGPPGGQYCPTCRGGAAANGGFW